MLNAKKMFLLTSSAISILNYLRMRSRIMVSMMKERKLYGLLNVAESIHEVEAAIDILNDVIATEEEAAAASLNMNKVP